MVCGNALNSPIYLLDLVFSRRLWRGMRAKQKNYGARLFLQNQSLVYLFGTTNGCPCVAGEEKGKSAVNLPGAGSEPVQLLVPASSTR